MDLLTPLRCDWDSQSHLRGRGGYNEAYQEIGDEENREVRAPVQCEATPGSLIDKLLNNPHAALRQEPRRYLLPAETEHQQ